MKQRLYGLMALVLCAMMVVAPGLAMGAGLVYSSLNDTPVSENDIILQFYYATLMYKNESNAPSATSSIQKISIDYGVQNIPNEEITVSGSGFKLKDPMNAQGADGWRIASMTESGDTLTLNLEAIFIDVQENGTHSPLIVGLREVFNEDTNKHATPDDIKNAFQTYAASNGYKEIITFREIKSYDYVGGSDYVIRPTKNWTSREVNFVERRYPLNSTTASAHLLHMLDDGSIEDLPITILNGSYAATLSSLSPFAIALDPNSSNSGGNNPGGAPNPLPSTPSTPNLPQTGDHSQLALWFALAALSLTGTVLTLRRRKA